MKRYMYDITTIQSVLEQFQQHPEIIKKNWGICHNLGLFYDDRKAAMTFMYDALTFINGKYEPFPIESTNDDDGSKMHHKTVNKWNINDKYGKKRFELLDKLIQYCKFVTELPNGDPTEW